MDSRIVSRQNPAMADEATNSRIVLSRQTLARYEQMPLHLVQPEQTLALLRGEITVLLGIVLEFPEKAQTVGDLVRRWQALGDRLKEKAN